MAWILVASGSAVAQEAILELSIEPASLTVAAGGEATVWVHAENESIREADDLTAYWIDPQDLGFAEEPHPIEVIKPFGSATLALRVAASPEADRGETPGSFEVVYTYCIDDSCYQIAESFDLPIVIVEPAPESVQTSSSVAVHPAHSDPTSAVPWQAIAFAAAVLVAALAFLFQRITGIRWPAYAMIAVLLGGGLLVGVFLDQHNQAQAIGAVLCTSCVGLEESRDEEPGFTAEQSDRLSALGEDVELIVFYAVWCHACPYAEGLVERASEAAERISYRFIDVETDRDLAEQHGVIRSGRTVVPAILRVDTGEVIFGVEGLEERLLTLLGVGR